jgi:creatinine amidohydrolase
MGHACEWETSMILRLAPHLVGEISSIDPVPQTASFAPASRGWITRERSEVGHIGDPRAATAEKGEALFRTFARDVVAFLERVSAWDGRSWEGS